MKKNNIERLIQKNPLAALAITLMVVALIGVGIWQVTRLLNPANKAAQVASISFVDGQNTVVVNQDGTVTITTPFGTFTQTWDKDKVRNFFNSLENLDFDMLTKYLGTGVAIQLIMGNGKTLMVAADPQLESATDQLEEALNLIYQDEERRRLRIVPTPTPELPSNQIPTPTPRPTGSSNGGSNPWQVNQATVDKKNFSCEQLDTQTGKKVIVSQTLCEK